MPRPPLIGIFQLGVVILLCYSMTPQFADQMENANFVTILLETSGVAMTDEIRAFNASIASIFDSERMLMVGLAFPPGQLGQTDLDAGIKFLKDAGVHWEDTSKMNLVIRTFLQALKSKMGSHENTAAHAGPASKRLKMEEAK